MTPTRTCVGCRRRAGQDELLRIVREPDGVLVVGRTAPGRGAWVCAATPGPCLDAAERRHALGRALRADLVPGSVARLRAEIVSGSER